MTRRVRRESIVDRRVLFSVLAVSVAAGLVLGALHVVEFALSPYRRLPANGMIGDQRYTWGHLVENNRLGFRERDFDSLKPPGTYRVMVLGDSFTWGVGLAPDERYTAVAERLLNSASADRVFEVLNFGVPGIPTTTERDILDQYRAVVDPDRIVVGFCINDPQPLYMAWSSERQRLAESAAGHAVRGGQMLLRALGVPWIAGLPGKAFYGIAEWAGWIPVWQVALQRAYGTSSDESADFLQAMRAI
ncbi:MAG: SGNH/GDSL hydrolase family protein, partial [Acidobacteria bacterium]|nr:SGNH/GDSL hydrolase family protein [Acidobacteriota bacterium]